MSDEQTPEAGEQAVTTMTKDFLGREVVDGATAGKDFLGREVQTGDKDFIGRSLVA